MDGVYNRLIQNLNTVKCDLKEIDNPNLDVCIQRIKEAIFDVGRLNCELVKLQAIQEMKSRTDFEVDDRWE